MLPAEMFMGEVRPARSRLMEVVATRVRIGARLAAA